MADQPLTIQGISWRQTFPFIHLFRAFRVAVHPSKLVLALAALILLYIGGHVLDLVWSVQYRAVPDEVTLYEQFTSHAKPGEKFVDARKTYRDEIEAAYAQQLLDYKVDTDLKTATTDAREGEKLGALKTAIIYDRDIAARNAGDDRKRAAAGADPATRASADREYKAAMRTIFARASDKYQSALRIKNVGLFETYFDYESNQLSNIVRAVREWNWFGEEPTPVAVDVNPLGLPVAFAETTAMQPGAVQSVVRCFTVGPIWLLSQHPLYFFLFGIWFLILWSLFGGAICRIAAVHVARDEKLSIRSALMFSGGKFLSFLFAPIIPLIIVVGVGLLVTAGSALANIPYFGPIVVGAIFFLALAPGSSWRWCCWD